MVRTCCVMGCNVRSHDRQGNKLENGLSFHCFPTWKQNQGARVSDVTKRRRLAWIAAVRRADIQFSTIPRYLLVCSRHFHSGKGKYNSHHHQHKKMLSLSGNQLIAF
uniref:THAP-type domain-containing protein n=1 Tax=Neolamprologus brichardi TaxID=32507 RepID=A0A3Q4HXU6_NEOBR